MLENLDKLPIGLQVIGWIVLVIAILSAVVCLGACVAAGKADEDMDKIIDQMPNCDKDADGHS